MLVQDLSAEQYFQKQPIQRPKHVFGVQLSNGERKSVQLGYEEKASHQQAKASSG